jgi:hypothetical protein
MSGRPMLYIAGPYTRPDPVVNAHAAIQVGTIVYEQTDYVPLVPHTTLLWHMVTPRPPDFWYALDIHHMLRCDAIVRLPGESTGADREMEVAIEMGLKVVEFKDLPDDAKMCWRARVAAF